MIQLSKSICGWQTVLIAILVAPVFVLNAQLFQPPQHYSNSIVPIQFPRYIIMFHQQQQQQNTNNAKNLETLNSRRISSGNDDSNRNVMVNAEKPVDAHRIEQLQQKQEPANYIDLDAKNKNAFFDEDGNKMRPHGQQGNVLRRQVIDGNAAMLTKGVTVTPPPVTTNRNVAPSTSFAEQLKNNLAANFSQSNSSNKRSPFTQYSLPMATGTSDTESKNEHQPQVIIINGPTRIYGDGTESKFPPFLEFFVQRIQKYFSIYKYEDLSRPALPSQMSVLVENAMAENLIGATTKKQINVAK